MVRMLKLTLGWQLDAAKLRKLRPAFKPDGGSVTAGNSSSIRYWSPP